MTSHETSRSHFPMLAQLADSWDEVKRGDGVLVSEQLARRLDLALGSELAIPTAGGIWRPTIVGVFPDYGNPKGQLRIDIDALTRRWPDAPRVTFGLRVAPDAVSRLIVAMQSQFGAQIVRIADQAAIKKISTRIFEHTFAVTAALSTLTLVVSAIALLASLTTLGDIRLAQVAPVWATGVPRRRLAQLEFLQNPSAHRLHRRRLVAARARPGVVPGGGGQRAGLRLAPSVLFFSRAVARDSGACAADGDNRRNGADHPFRPDHAGGVGEGFCQ